MGDKIQGVKEVVKGKLKKDPDLVKVGIQIRCCEGHCLTYIFRKEMTAAREK